MLYIVLTAFFLALNGLGVIEKNSFTRLLPNLVLAFGVIKYAFFKKGHLFVGQKFERIDLFLYVIFLILLIISLVRTHGPYASPTGIANDVATVILINAFIYLGFSFQYRGQSGSNKMTNKITGPVIFAPSVLILFMLLLYLLAYNSGTLVEGEGRGRAVILGALGIAAEKRNIPFIGVHPNYIGIFAGGIFVMSVLGLKYLDRSFRKYLFFNILVCFVFMLIVDSRLTFLNSMLSLAMVFGLLKLRALGFLRFTVVLIPIMPLLFLSIMSFIAQSESMQTLARNSQDLATGNSRAYIWAHCYNEILNPKTAHIMGFGEHGHIGSEVSSKYAYIFVESDKPLQTVTHNVFLQSFLDVGYVGTFVFLVILFLALDAAIKLYRKGARPAIVYLGFLVYFVLSGTSESNFGHYNRTYFLIFMVMVLTVLLIKNSYLRRSPKDL